MGTDDGNTHNSRYEKDYESRTRMKDGDNKAKASSVSSAG